VGPKHFENEKQNGTELLMMMELNKAGLGSALRPPSRIWARVWAPNSTSAAARN